MTPREKLEDTLDGLREVVAVHTKPSQVALVESLLDIIADIRWFLDGLDSQEEVE